METEIIQQLDVIAKNIQALAEPKFIEYIALLISFISVIVSGLAIWFAVQVPKKIADRQDKIALFEKRLLCFQELNRHISFCKVIGNDCEQIRHQFKHWFMDGLHEISVDESILYIKNNIRIMYNIPFLFYGINENEIDEIDVNFLILVYHLMSYKKDITLELSKYKKSINDFTDRHLEEIIKNIKL